MKKNNSGITLLSLVITIIVLLILSSITVYSGISTIRSAQLTKFTTELKIMQEKVNELYNSYTNNKSVKVNGIEYIGKGQEQTDTTSKIYGIQEIGKELEVAPQDKLNEASSGSGINIIAANGYRYYDEEIIKALEVEGVEGTFFVNISNRQVISVDGLRYEGEKYYTLDQVPDSVYNVEYDNIAGNLTFQTTSEVQYGIGKIHVININYDKYVNKWQLRYRVKAEEGEKENTWYVTEEFTGNEYTIDNIPTENLLATYEVQVVHGDEIASEIQEAYVLQVGDYVNYTYDSVTEGYPLPPEVTGQSYTQQIYQVSGKKWRILNVQSDGKIDLVADVTSSDQSLTLMGAKGYNNAVYVLNDICKKLYSNSSLNVEARSINLEDVEGLMNETGLAARYTSNIQTGIYYQQTKTYTADKTYPALYAREKGSGIDVDEARKDGLGISEDGYDDVTDETTNTAKEKLIVTQTAYQLSNNKDYFDDKVYDVLINNTDGGRNYWLASRCTIPSSYAVWGLFNIENFTVDTDGLVNCWGNPTSSWNRIRPIVSLGSDIKLTSYEGEDGHMYAINEE